MRKRNLPKTDDHGMAQKLYFSNFYNNIINNNRFFPCDEIIPLLDNICSSYSNTIEKGAILYRARIINKKNIDNVIKNASPPFYGFNKKDSFIPPPNLSSEGRANAIGIRYLYLAYEEETALIEVRPIIEDRVSIAQIVIKSDLKYIDLTAENCISPINSISPLLTHYIKQYISFDFSMPIQHYDKDDYIPTQYIASYFNSKGYEAIKYESSLNPGGANLVVFSGNKACPTNSRIVQVTSIGLTSRSISPKEEKKLEIKLKQ